MKRVRADTKRDKADFVESCNQKMLKLEEDLEKKSQELEVMKGELKLVKEFRRKRAAMQKELDDIKVGWLFCLWLVGRSASWVVGWKSEIER